MILTRSCAPEAASHNRTAQSTEPEASVRPSGDHATLKTMWVWPSNVCDEGEGRAKLGEKNQSLGLMLEAEETQWATAYPQQSARRCVPQPHGIVVRARGQRAAVGRPGNMRDPPLVAIERLRGNLSERRI